MVNRKSKFEYKLVKKYYLNESHAMEQLIELDKEGWEAVGISDNTLLVKRPIKQD